MFAVAASQPRIKRLYIYDWTGGVNSTRFDAGLMNAHDQPRLGYTVVCKALHATRVQRASRLRRTERGQTGEELSRAGGDAARWRCPPPRARCVPGASLAPAPPPPLRAGRACATGRSQSPCAARWGRPRAGCRVGPGDRFPAASREHREQAPADEHEQPRPQRGAPDRRRRGWPAASTTAPPAASRNGQITPSAPETVGGGDRRLEEALAQIAGPDDGLGLVPHERVGDRRHHRGGDRHRRQRDRRPGPALERERHREREERQHRGQKARSHEAAAEGQVVAGVVAHVAEAHAGDRQRLGALAAAVEQHRAERPEARAPAGIVSNPRESNSSVASTFEETGAPMPKEAFLLARHVGVGEVRPGVKRVVVVEQQRLITIPPTMYAPARLQSSARA